MKVLFAASEAVPFCKTGGLADVAGSLPLALKEKKADVRLVLPKYRAVDEKIFGLKPTGFRLTLPLGDSWETVSLWEGRLAASGPGRGVPVYFVDAPKYFDRSGLYVDEDGRDYPDNDDRFVLFSRAVIETAKAVDFRPDVVHVHDWQTGLVPAYLATVYRHDAFFLPTSTVFTVHNMAYQGLFAKNTVFLAGFPWSEFTPDRLEYYDRVNFLKAGLVYAKKITTVSPTYARETQTPEGGHGMDGLLQKRSADYAGVLNGLDVKLWDPAKDAHLAQHFGPSTLGRRAACRADLEKECGWKPDPSAPLLGCVCRVDAQKGVDMLLEILPPFLEQGARVVFVGHGDRAIMSALEGLRDSRPDKVHYDPTFNEPLARKIYGGADVFLMPSRFEPCGLGQMISLRYGAVPVVTPVGGLKDTIASYDPAGRGWGFVAERADAAAYAAALERALDLYRKDPAAWTALIKRGMARPFGWSVSADRYLDVYEQARAGKNTPAA